eukprot:scaffold71353_cov45-Phaeocystis_antarctica.AAC.1
MAARVAVRTRRAALHAAADLVSAEALEEARARGRRRAFERARARANRAQGHGRRRTSTGLDVWPMSMSCMARSRFHNFRKCSVFPPVSNSRPCDPQRTRRVAHVDPGPGATDAHSRSGRVACGP